MHSYTPCGTHMAGSEVKINVTLMVTVCIASFKAIGKLQKEGLHQLHAVAFALNG